MSYRTSNRANKSIDYTLPCPTGGLNARDSLDLMPETEAITMDNYLPQETKVCLRKGYVRYVATGCPIKTLVSYKNCDGTNRFFGFGGNGLWNLTAASTAAPVSEIETTSSLWQTCQFKNRLFAVNGLDNPLTYSVDETGTGHWDVLNFTGEGLNPKRLVNVASSKQRLWFVEKGSLTAWYAANAGDVQGTLEPFYFDTVARDGGYLVAVACWTQDGGNGIDDLTVFLTSEGEALVYAGSDPGNIEDWTLKGIYRISRPIGYRCTLQHEGDLVIITEDGYVPLSKMMPLNGVTSAVATFSDKIRGLVLNRTQTGKAKEGWQGIIYSRGGYALFNVPVSQQFEQHVINTNSGAWCRFTGIRALCWGLFNTRLYFGTDDGVMLFDEGYTDNGVAIEGKVEQAFSALGQVGLKKVQLINPRTKSSKLFALVVYTNTDFGSVDQGYSETIGVGGLSKWNVLKWSSATKPTGSKWATLRGQIRSQWIGNSATGFKIGLVFKTKTKGTLIEWFDTGFRYERGTGII